MISRRDRVSVQPNAIHTTPCASIAIEGVSSSGAGTSRTVVTDRSATEIRESTAEVD
jgi:hypothetical protein